MSFHDVQFPANISLGSRGGPIFRTNVVELPSGASYREARWDNPIYHYDARYGVASHEDMYDLIEFIVARQGPVHSFRFKDWRDYASTATGTLHNPGDTIVDDEDVEIGVGDGSTTQFQIIKKYTSGSTTRTRNIFLPKNLVVAVDGVSQTETTDYSVDYATGIITFVAAPAGSLSVTCGFEFDVKVRFGAEIDEAAMVSLDEFDTESLPNMPIVEDIDGTATEDEYLYGGGYNHGDQAGGQVSVSKSQGLVHVVNPTSGSTVVQLPSVSGIQEGGPHFVITHAGGGGGSLIIKDNALTTNIRTLSSGNTAALIFYMGSTWYVV